MNFRASFCDPLKPNIIELGDIAEENIIPIFEKIPWIDLLKKMETAEETYYSPSLEIENKDTRHGLCISVIGDADDYEFYVFYKRPRKTFSLLSTQKTEDHMTEKDGQTHENVIDCLNALRLNDTEYLDKAIGE